jgi:hypothetical protein
VDFRDENIQKISLSRSQEDDRDTEKAWLYLESCVHGQKAVTQFMRGEEIQGCDLFLASFFHLPVVPSAWANEEMKDFKSVCELVPRALSLMTDELAEQAFAHYEQTMKKLKDEHKDPFSLYYASPPGSSSRPKNETLAARRRNERKAAEAAESFFEAEQKQAKQLNRRQIESVLCARLRQARAGLNESQRSSVDVARKSRVSVVQGPPGTGKTSTIAVLALDSVLSLLLAENSSSPHSGLRQDSMRRVLCVAETNCAARHMASHIARLVPAVCCVGVVCCVVLGEMCVRKTSGRVFMWVVLFGSGACWSESFC